MTIGVGGSTAEIELAKLSDMTGGTSPITLDEYQSRIQKAQRLMAEQGLSAIYLDAGSNLRYFTGMQWKKSERMVGAFIVQSGPPQFIAPTFEIGTLEQFMEVQGPVHGWEEHECPYALSVKILSEHDMNDGVVGISEDTPFFISNGLAKAAPALTFDSATAVTRTCRQQKSMHELTLMTRAKEMTLAVHKATAAMLREGITSAEVGDFLDAAHRKVGAPKGSYFKIVLFGPDSSYPHGVRHHKPLEDGDMVLIDTGCQCHDYISDMTRSYVFGTPSAEQRRVWDAEKRAQIAAFEAAQIGVRCGDADLAARKSLEADGFGPGYKTPGLPHRTGHGIGLDIHEWPYLNWGDDTPLAPGMCFSSEPMICKYGEFGVRLEDHFYMAADGPVWFTQPSHSIDEPFKGV
ncbi:M24 family metallopeptidase [Fretibacter rubidus]|uniref:M24 family metallopeptidase n=1 Tax=Fretibacter rubidus TaxID=570162 RepID=UPI003529EA66